MIFEWDESKERINIYINMELILVQPLLFLVMIIVLKNMMSRIP